jgi:hypothetical protein
MEIGSVSLRNAFIMNSPPFMRLCVVVKTGPSNWVELCHDFAVLKGLSFDAPSLIEDFLGPTGANICQGQVLRVFMIAIVVWHEREKFSLSSALVP